MIERERADIVSRSCNGGQEQGQAQATHFWPYSPPGIILKLKQISVRTCHKPSTRASKVEEA